LKAVDALQNEVAWGRLRHERMLSGETAAFEEICDRYYDSIVMHVKRTANKYGEITPDDGMIADAVTTALVNYRQKPKAFNPSKASLLTYLKMSAAGDYLNMVAKRTRERQRFVEKDEEFWKRESDADARGFEDRVILDHGNSLADKLTKHCVTNDEDRLIFEMLVDRVRDSKTCLSMLNWPESPENIERLRRAKERVDKCIKRAGRRLRLEDE
jgi:DNA-directed RNA polymerase specialized sigma24 family protein